MIESHLNAYLEIDATFPVYLTDDTMVMMDPDGLFWGASVEDGERLPEQGRERTVHVLRHLKEYTVRVTL